jgi:uncharacterized NAD(P)/FAD-binding protein YdhS
VFVNSSDHLRFPKQLIAIVGGGFSGATLAAQLLRHARDMFSIVVVDKKSAPGCGIAYSTTCDGHLLNVPAGDMSAFPEDPEHFLRWAKSNGFPSAHQSTFLPRTAYGRYLQSTLHECSRSCNEDDLQWIRDEACSIDFVNEGLELCLRGGQRILAHKIILAVGNFPPSDPFFPDTALNQDSVRIPRPWSVEAMHSLESLRSVLLLGTALTSVDIAIELRARGFRGTIHFLSRRGLLPQSHFAGSRWPQFWDHASSHSPKDVRSLARLIRQQVQQAREQNIPWQQVIAALRPVTQEIWQTLPLPEKRRFLRHLRPYWDLHRHRVAPEIAARIQSWKDQGEIQVHAGRITNYWQDENEIVIAYRERKTQLERHLRVDRMINCTGPEADYRRLDDPLIAFLLDRQMIRPDPLFLGLDISSHGALLNENGVPSRFLYAIGPARKGTLWETTAVPEIRQQVRDLVAHFLHDRTRQLPDPVNHNDATAQSPQI